MSTLISRDPALVWNPLSEAESQSRITPIQWIVHTAVDGPGSTNLHGYFENHTNLESHTWLRFGGRHEQLMSFLRRADANYRANYFTYNGKPAGAISTETEDDGSPVEHPWDDKQLSELIRFGTWLSLTYDIPPTLARTPFSPGMGWHVLFPDHWTNAPGKTCPGHKRVNQFTQIVLPGIAAAVAKIVTPHSEDEMVDDIERLHVIYLGANPDPHKWDQDMLKSVDHHLEWYLAGRPLADIRKDFRNTARKRFA